MTAIDLLRRPFAIAKRLVSRDQLEMSTTSGFFRNSPQLLTLTSIVPKPTRVYVFGCSVGCEAYSIRMAYAIWKPDARFELHGFDIDPVVLTAARNATYSRAHVDYYGGDEVSRGPAQRFFRYQDATRSWRVIDEIARGCRFDEGSVLDRQFVATLPQADVVLCQNVLVHMTDEQNRVALANLSRVVAPSGVLVIGGMRMDVRARLTRELGLVPVLDSVAEIHDSWRDLRRIWDTTQPRLRPYFALEPFEPGPAAGYRYGTVFRVSS